MRKFEDWEFAARNIPGIMNSYSAGFLMEECFYLGELDVMISEHIAQRQTGKSPINVGARITLLARLWILHAYEIVRCLDEDERIKTGKDASNRRFYPLKNKLAKIRIPMAKIQKNGSNKNKDYSYITMSKGGTSGISFSSYEGDSLCREDIAQEFLDLLMNYFS